MRVMISAAASPAAASILRHLRSLGHTVIGLDASPEAAPLGRAFCDEFYLSPPADSSAYLSFLEARVAEVDLFLPFIDEELLALAQQWHRLQPDMLKKVAISEPATLIECLDKCKFQRACEEAQLPIAPETRTAPLFFKPRYGRGGKGVIALRDSQSIAAFEGRDGVFQREVDGEEFTVDAIFNRDSQLIATSARRRLRTTGVSTVGQVVPDSMLHELAQRIGMRWRFRYAINFQSIRDADGKDWIIELNPRLSGSGIFSAMAGCDPFAATIALWQRQPWTGSARPLRVWRYWQEMTDE